MVQQRGALVPRRVGRVFGHVVAVQSGDRDEHEVVDVELARELGELVADLVEARLLVLDEVHLVHAQHEVLHLQERRDHRVTARLLEYTLARVDQDEREVGGRRAGHHVARVLHVTGRVGDDELAARGGEVAVRDVDRDALLALGAQAVGEEGKVGVVEPAVAARTLDRLELVLEDLLGLEQEPPDERALAVVDRPRGGEPQHLHQLEVPLALAVLHRGLGEPSSARVSPRSVTRDAAISAITSSIATALDSTAPVHDASPTVR